jgi:hypothetical protein
MLSTPPSAQLERELHRTAQLEREMISIEIKMIQTSRIKHLTKWVEKENQPSFLPLVQDVWNVI